jgi:hypothetical protein
MSASGTATAGVVILSFGTRRHIKSAASLAAQAAIFPARSNLLLFAGCQSTSAAGTVLSPEAARLS